jgi:hypothetical protein
VREDTIVGVPLLLVHEPNCDQTPPVIYYLGWEKDKNKHKAGVLLIQIESSHVIFFKTI